MADAPAFNLYGSIAAEIYDIDKPIGAMPDTAFHLGRLADAPGEVLEPACGSGRTLVPLLLAGRQVTGFDSSPEMLAQCQARCSEDGFAPDLSLQTFADFRYDRSFGVILVPAGSFCLIDRYEAAMATLRRFRDHLAPGGRVMLDIVSLSDIANMATDRRSWTAASGDFLTLEGVRVKTDWVGQRYESIYRYERWRDNHLVESQIDPMAMRCWGLEEFSMALRDAGFVEVTVTPNYRSGRPIGEKTRILTFEAIRP